MVSLVFFSLNSNDYWKRCGNYTVKKWLLGRGIIEGTGFIIHSELNRAVASSWSIKLAQRFIRWAERLLDFDAKWTIIRQCTFCLAAAISDRLLWIDWLIVGRGQVPVAWHCSGRIHYKRCKLQIKKDLADCWLLQSWVNHHDWLFFVFSLIAADCECGCVESSTIVSTVTGPPPVSVAAPTNANKTATKVANSGGHANNTQAPAKRSSSGADGDYALVQHEVLFSLSAQYEVSFCVDVEGVNGLNGWKNVVLCAFTPIQSSAPRFRRDMENNWESAWGSFLVVCSLGSFFDLSILKRDVVEKTRRAILMGLGGRERACRSTIGK